MIVANTVNQVWVRMLAWRVSISMNTDFCIEAVEEALAKYRTPEIFNTDQGSQFTSAEFTALLEKQTLAEMLSPQSMQGVSRIGELRSLPFAIDMRYEARPRVIDLQVIAACAERAAPDRVCVEFRNRTWMTPENQDETLGFLAGHRLAYVCVDMPQGHRDSIPPVLAATAPDLAVVRMHGHSAKWDSKDIHERFGYRYSDGELKEWAPRIRHLADRAVTTHVLFNNCYRDYAQVNAQQLAALLPSGVPEAEQ